LFSWLLNEITSVILIESRKRFEDGTYAPHSYRIAILVEGGKVLAEVLSA